MIRWETVSVSRWVLLIAEC